MTTGQRTRLTSFFVINAGKLAYRTQPLKTAWIFQEKINGNPFQ